MFTLVALGGCIMSKNALHADESTQQRKQRLESLTDDEKENLLEKQKRFYALDPIESLYPRARETGART